MAAVGATENVRGVVGGDSPYSRVVRIGNPGELAAALGGGGRAYVHDQAVPSRTWDITHSLGNRYPRVLALDASGAVMYGAVDYAGGTENFLRIEFYVPAAGRAIVTG